MTYKQETIRTYDAFPDSFDRKFQEHFDSHVKKNADEFLKFLKGRKILDLGCGPGNHAAYFKQKGFDVLCLDLSDEMLKLCRKKGLKAIKMDIEDLSFPDGSFDGIWAYASLLHVPKGKAPEVIAKLYKMLVPGGILAVALKEGEGERLEANEKYPGTERLFAYYTDPEIREIFSSFRFLGHGRRDFERYSFLNYVMRRD